MKWMPAMLLCLIPFTSALAGIQYDDVKLVQKQCQLYQLWTLSRDYRFGTSVPHDDIQSYAWSNVYLDLLPKSYPNKSSIGQSIRPSLNLDEQLKAEQLTELYRTQYQLNQPMTEEQFIRAFHLQQHPSDHLDIEYKQPEPADLHEFSEWVTWIKKSYPESDIEPLQERFKQLQDEGVSIIYGQIAVQGCYMPQMVQSNHPLYINKDGFFVSKMNKKELRLQLAGFYTQSIRLNRNQNELSLGILKMIPVQQPAKTGVVGRIVPWNEQNTNIILKLKPDPEFISADQDSPWSHVVVPLFSGQNGDFYATGLSPGQYRLYVQNDHKSIFKDFIVKEGEIRGLSIINMS